MNNSLFGHEFIKINNCYYSDTCRLITRYYNNILYITLDGRKKDIGKIKVKSDSFSEIIDNQESILKIIIEHKAKKTKKYYSILNDLNQIMNGLDIFI
jgi:hypothetical protein